MTTDKVETGKTFPDLENLKFGAGFRENNPHIEKVCKVGKVGCCRYILMGAGWECGKLIPSLKLLLDAKVAKGTMRAVGDNCEGKSKQFLNL